MYTIYFENSLGQERIIGTGRNEASVFMVVNNFLEDKNYKNYYIREWNSDGRTHLDVGSYTEFFHVEPELREENDE